MQNETDITKIPNIEKLVPLNYLKNATDFKKSSEVQTRVLLEKRKIPDVGWTEATIEDFVNYLASLDTNNFQTAGLGEREGRVVCNLVARRHYRFAHGIGRSGDLLEPQPKAAGSTLLSTLTNSLLLDLLRNVGLKSTVECFLCPMATGMTLTLCMLALKKENPNATHVLWSRIDQKSCFKCITGANLRPVIIDMLNSPEGLQTDIDKFEEHITTIGAEKILCILSTTSCFAPRNCDDIFALSQLSKKNGIPHIVNNAYGLQSTEIIQLIENGNMWGRIDLCVQSVDKNLMCPVGGAIVAGFNDILVKSVARTYAGRASSSHSLDVLMTLLHLGKLGYRNYKEERQEVFEYLRLKLGNFALAHQETLLPAKKNSISLCMTLNSFKNLPNITQLGSMLYLRGVSGARVISPNETKEIDGFRFTGWGSHMSDFSIPYLTVAASIGVKKSDVDVFLVKLSQCWSKMVLPSTSTNVPKD